MTHVLTFTGTMPANEQQTADCGNLRNFSGKWRILKIAHKTIIIHTDRKIATNTNSKQKTILTTSRHNLVTLVC